MIKGSTNSIRHQLCSLLPVVIIWPWTTGLIPNFRLNKPFISCLKGFFFIMGVSLQDLLDLSEEWEALLCNLWHLREEELQLVCSNMFPNWLSMQVNLSSNINTIINSYSSRTRRIRADIYITKEAIGRVGYYQLISGKAEKNNCFSKFSSSWITGNCHSKFFPTFSNRDISFTDDAAKNFFSDLQNISTRNSPSVFPYLVKLNDNGSYQGLREPIRKLENHYPELKIY